VCRIEPENNVHMIVEAFSKQDGLPLVMVGNWKSSEYGRGLQERFAGEPHIYLLDPIYDLGKLYTLRSRALLYVHGHSAGGTNPSLVEAMHFAKPIVAYDCNFNRFTTEDKALFFKDQASLQRLVVEIDSLPLTKVSGDMQAIAKQNYTWDIVAEQYFNLF